MVTLKEVNELRDTINDMYSRAKQIQREAARLENTELKRLHREWDRENTRRAKGK